MTLVALTLATVICIHSGEREPWRSGSALLVDDAPYRAKLYLAEFVDVRDDPVGDWDWTSTAVEVPLRMVDKSVRGSVIIRGRASAKPTRL